MSGDIYQSLYQSMKSIFLHLDDGERTLFSKFGLTTSRFYILKHVFMNPGISYIDLSDLMLCTKGNTTRIVQGMLEDQLIDRVENPQDRRSFQLFLSNSGKILYKEVDTEYKEYIRRLISKLNEDQLEHFADVSNTIERGLEKAIR